MITILLWLKKHWWKLLVIPIVFLILFHMMKYIAILYCNNSIPDMSDLEIDLRESLEALREDERIVLEEIRKERDELWRKIDLGNPSAAEIFNKELKS